VSVTLARPAGTTAGHVLVAAVSARNGTGVAAPSGWAEAVRTTCVGNDDIELTQVVFVRAVAPGEPDVYAFTATATGIAGALAAYAGVDVQLPVLAAGGQIRRNSRLTTAPSVTAPVPGALLLGAFSNSGRSPLTAPSGMTARIAAAATPDVRLLLADELRPAAGATGDRTASSAQPNTCGVGQLVALRPAPDPPVSTAPPAISGSAQEGRTLTATNGSWANAPVSYALRWQRGDGTTWTDVPGAVSGAYTAVAADVGLRLRVVVTAANSGGSGVAASAPTQIVLPAAPANTVPPAVAGEAREHATLTADPGTWTGSPQLALQWQRSPDGVNWHPVDGATAAEYTAAPVDVGSRLRVLVTATNAGGTATAVSQPTGVVEPAAPPSPLQPPLVTGWRQEGELLSATTGTWTGSPTSFAYAWERSADGGAWTAIEGADGAAYLLGAADVGQLVRVVVTASNANGPGTAPSDPAGPIAAAAPPVNVAPPAITGAPQYGIPLQAEPGTWANAPAAFAYQWRRSSADELGWEDVEGAVGTTYVPGTADVGRRLLVVVTAANAHGSASASSAPTDPVLHPPPTSVSPPVVEGPAVEGEVVTASAGEWTGVPDDFAYVWQRCGSESCEEIRWETDPHYTVRRDDVGLRLRAVVTASSASGSASAESALTEIVLPHAPVNEEPPVVSGHPAQGETLSAAPGDWDSTGSVTYAYRWERSADGGQTWAAVAGADEPTHVLGAGDVGHVYRVVVTATNAGGSTEAASAQTEAVSPPGPPAVLAAPTISGTVQQAGRLTAVPGTWSGTPTFTYVWQRSSDGGATWSAIPRATSYRYTAAAADVGRLVRVLVTGRNQHGSATVPSETWLIHPLGDHAYVVNATWYCDDEVDLDLVHVVIRDGAGRDALRLDECSGRIGRVEVETNGLDGIKVRNTAPVAHDLVVESGFVFCTGRPEGAHQDGIQVMGGSRITFANLVIWCSSDDEFGDGVNSSALISRAGAAATTPVDVVIEHSVMGPGTTNGVLVGNSVRSGLRSSVACPDRTTAGGPVLLEPEAVDGVDVDNEKPGLEDPRCSSFEAALAWAGG
jgi:hypothetical protein